MRELDTEGACHSTPGGDCNAWLGRESTGCQTSRLFPRASRNPTHVEDAINWRASSTRGVKGPLEFSYRHLLDHRLPDSRNPSGGGRQGDCPRDLVTIAM